MAEQSGLTIIESFRQRWIAYRLLINALLALAIAVPAGCALHLLLGGSFWWLLLMFAMAFAAICLHYNPLLINNIHVTRFLNRQHQQLEESAELTLQPVHQLNILQKLQLAKVEAALQNLPLQPGPLAKQLRVAAFITAAAIAASFVLLKLPYHHHRAAYGNFVNNSPAGPVLPAERVLPQIEAVTVSISPPAYTGRPRREQDKFTIIAEEGAGISWRLKTNVAVKQVTLLLNGKDKIVFSSINQTPTHWNAQAAISSSGFYQLSVDGKLSDLYQIRIIKDSAPVICIKTPKPYTYIDAGEAQRVLMNAQVSDDYGVADALLVATVAKGSGEAVKFKEYKLPFPASFAEHKPQYTLQQLLDLPALSMEPGDELYFYLQARDTRRQQSRTDVYTVSIQDTAQLLSMDGLVTGSSIKPEFFRSERQIILDSEGLIKARDSISADQYKNRCNDIATDQKLLRLRYGKFLGEEEESKVGQAEEGNDLGNIENFNNAAKILDAYTDKHDNAEDAGYLEPAIKAQLKATLTEMWKAELQLRLYKPGDALPFEYKALRLLKDLQQKSRSYVAKTAYNPPPLKVEKRLSGDLSKIITPVNQRNEKPAADPFAGIKTAVGILEQARNVTALNTYDKRRLQAISAQLNSRAAAQPGLYLSAVGAMHRLLGSPRASAADINRVESALQKMLPQAKAMPQAATAAADMGLGQGYYNQLNHLNR